jgi:hypothetical protein
VFVPPLPANVTELRTGITAAVAEVTREILYSYVFALRYKLHYAHTVYLCVPYGSHNKQRLFPQTALTGCAL